MPAYSITNSDGTPVATIGIATTTGATFPIELIGQGVALYGPIIGTSQYRMMENFASATPPANPVTGMIWYDKAGRTPQFHDGTAFSPLSGLTTNSAALLDMLPTAETVDLTTQATVSLFTDPNLGDTYHVTGLMLVVNGTPTAVDPAILNLFVTDSEDVLENINVPLTEASQHGYYLIQGRTKAVTAGNTIHMEVVNPASGGDLSVSVYLFGFKT